MLKLVLNFLTRTVSFIYSFFYSYIVFNNYRTVSFEGPPEELVLHACVVKGEDYKFDITDKVREASRDTTLYEILEGVPFEKDQTVKVFKSETCKVFSLNENSFLL